MSHLLGAQGFGTQSHLQVGQLGASAPGLALLVSRGPSLEARTAEVRVFPVPNTESQGPRRAQGWFLQGPLSLLGRYRLLPVSSRGHPSVHQCVCVPIPSSYKDTGQTDKTHMTSFYLDHL